MFHPCLLIPVYNHGALIEATWARLRELKLPCLMVDDGSEPGTAQVLDRLAMEEPLITLFRQPRNQGKGVAVLRGIAEAHRLGYTHALQIDADGQHDTQDIPAMLALAEQEPAALISGAPRYGDDIPRARLYGRYITHVWVWIETLSFDLRDSMCGFRVYPVADTHALAQQVAIGARMTFDTDIMVRLYWAGTPVRFLPTRVVYPENGISHFRPLRDNLQITTMHTRLVCGMLWRLPTLLRKKWLLRKKFTHSHGPAHWAEQRERGALWGMRFCLYCYRTLGRRALYLLLYPIISWFFLFGHEQRRASQVFLTRALGRPANWRDSFRHFLAFGRAVVDKLAAWTGDIRRDDVQFDERELLLRQAASGRGAVIITSHLGNVDMCRALVNSVPGIHLNVLVFNRNAQQINRVLREANPHLGMELIQIDEIGPHTGMLLADKIARGEFVIIAADRLPPSANPRASTALFLGENALFPQGPFILAALLECPVYLLFALALTSLESHGSRYRIFLEHFAEQLHLPRRSREALLADIIQRYADRLAYYCRLAPLQWFNFFDVWRPATATDTASKHQERITSP